MTNKEIIKNRVNRVYNEYKENMQKIKNYNELLEFESIMKFGIKIDNLILDKIKILKNNFKNNNLEITDELLTIDYIEDSIDDVINYYIED